MDRRLFLALLGGSLASFPYTAFAQTGAGYGAVILHGKSSEPGAMSGVASALQAAGVRVVTPEMGWSRRRMYDVTWLEALGEIDAAVSQLRGQGASKILVGGHSMGGNAALSYAGRRSVAGVIALAPGHTPETASFQKVVGASLVQARQMIAAGQGNATGSFMDSNAGRISSVTATARVYADLFDPNGAASLRRNFAGVSAPLFLADGSEDPLTPYTQPLFHPRSKKSRYEVVSGGHLAVPNAAAADAASWVSSL